MAEVLSGSVSKAADGGKVRREHELDPYQVPKDLKIFEEVTSSSSTTAPRVDLASSRAVDF